MDEGIGDEYDERRKCRSGKKPGMIRTRQWGTTVSHLHGRRVGKAVACGVREGDGVDPKHEKKTRITWSSSGKRDHSLLRLASQIRDTLDLAIPESGHPLLSSFAVSSVELSSTGGAFVVVVYSTDPLVEYDPRQIKAALDEMKSELRSEVAKEVTRKNAPDFRFEILPPKVQPR